MSSHQNFAPLTQAIARFALIIFCTSRAFVYRLVTLTKNPGPSRWCLWSAYMSTNKKESTDNRRTASSSTRTEELKNLRLTYLELLNEAEELKDNLEIVSYDRMQSALQSSKELYERATQNGGILEQLFDVELISLFSKLLLERSCRVASDFMNLSNFAQKQIEYNSSICPDNETVRKQWQKLGRHRFLQLCIPLNHAISSSENKIQEASAKSQSRKRVVQSVSQDESLTTVDSFQLKQVQTKDDSDASILCDFVYREFRRACKKRNVDRLDVSEFVCDPNSFDKTDDILVLRMTDEIHADLMLHSTAEDIPNVDVKYCTQEVIKAFNITTALIGPFPDI
ncbi:hypothetical protein T05_13273 [Trichinella murrelli]|uniref:Non-structural maintenance of chromosomes element 4 n=1 Tax=Trichinella murrelli TaxID=144512 RepID=A0A0V0UBI2_9BILA|nr:hypothetical protein T05_13273 [Trichinella murrelli]